MTGSGTATNMRYPLLLTRRGQEVLDDVPTTLQSMFIEASGAYSNVCVTTMDATRYFAKR